MLTVVNIYIMFPNIIGLMDHLSPQPQREWHTSWSPNDLPSSFSGSPRDMQQNDQVTMAIVAKYAKPDLFLTYTNNPNAQEITENLGIGERAEHRPDLWSRSTPPWHQGSPCPWNTCDKCTHDRVRPVPLPNADHPSRRGQTLHPWWYWQDHQCWDTRPRGGLRIVWAGQVLTLWYAEAQQFLHRGWEVQEEFHKTFSRSNCRELEWTEEKRW